MTPATITPPSRAPLSPLTVQAVADAHGIAPDVLAELRDAFRNEAAPRPIFTEAVALELAKLVGKDWLDVGIHLAHEYDWSMATPGDPDPAVTIVVTIGLPTDGRRFQLGRGFTLAGAIASARPVYEVAA